MLPAGRPQATDLYAGPLAGPLAHGLLEHRGIGVEALSIEPGLGPAAIPTRSGMIPQIGTFDSVHQAQLQPDRWSQASQRQ